MIPIQHIEIGRISGSFRMEDVRFSPSGRRLALVATENCILIYAVDLQTQPIQVSLEMELRSPNLAVPHGVEFLDEDLLVIANRDADMALFAIPAASDQPVLHQIEALQTFRCDWFAERGVKRSLRGRPLFCGPGSVRMEQQSLYVCCNYKNSVTRHPFIRAPHGLVLDPPTLLIGSGLEIIDGIALSRDGRFLAASDHDHHRVVVFARVPGRPDEPLRELASLRDPELKYPHGLCFSSDGTVLFACDAGSQYLYRYATVDDWVSSQEVSPGKQVAVADTAFHQTRSTTDESVRHLEGGAKGIDLSPCGRILAITCRNQPLRFFETDALARPSLPARQSPLENRRRVAVSCLVDDQPGIWRSLTPWLATVLQLAEIKPADVYVHHVCDLPPAVAVLCARLGVQTRAVARFDAGNPYTNKIGQCGTDYGDVDLVVLTDVDVVFGARPPWESVQAPIAGKLVDLPNPSLEVLHNLFMAAGLAPGPSCQTSYVKEGVSHHFATLPGNFNGGLYVIARAELPALGQRWAIWARWLLRRPALLDRWQRNIDQIAFCLALREARLAMQVLDSHWNFPAHIPCAPLTAEPWIIHHHCLLDENEQLVDLRDILAQPTVRRVNAVLAAFQQQFDTPLLTTGVAVT